MKDRSEKVAIVVPIYKETINNIEKYVIENINEKFIAQKKFLITHESLILDSYFTELLLNKNWSIIYFESYFFANIGGYNKLLLNKSFYHTFVTRKFKYILIHQLDAFVFRNDVEKWIDSRIDYVGSPWQDNSNLIKILNSPHKRLFIFLIKVNKIFFRKRDWTVGNGGLSLRNVKKCSFVLKWFGGILKKFDINEDVVWSIVVPLLFPFFKVPNEEEAIDFSFETEPSKRYLQNGESLPFGCHAWEKYEYNFWKEWIKINVF